jgi:hypothetical protein
VGIGAAVSLLHKSYRYFPEPCCRYLHKSFTALFSFIGVVPKSTAPFLESVYFALGLALGARVGLGNLWRPQSRQRRHPVPRVGGCCLQLGAPSSLAQESSTGTFGLCQVVLECATFSVLKGGVAMRSCISAFALLVVATLIVFGIPTARTRPVGTWRCCPVASSLLRSRPMFGKWTLIEGSTVTTEFRSTRVPPECLQGPILNRHEVPPEIGRDN